MRSNSSSEQEDMVWGERSWTSGSKGLRGNERVKLSRSTDMDIVSGCQNFLLVISGDDVDLFVMNSSSISFYLEVECIHLLGSLE